MKLKNILLKESAILADRFSNAVKEHPVWKSDLIKNTSNCVYSREQLSFLFQQYQHYSSNFTRFLCLAASRMDQPIHRAVVIDNLYEEVGESDIENRHSNLLRQFLLRMGVDRSESKLESYTSLYVERCISYLAHCNAIEAASFLAWGTEGIVPELYTCFVAALKAVGLSDEEIKYFSIHIECDDGHHEALMNVALDLYHQSSTKEDKLINEQYIVNGLMKALDLRLSFFESLSQSLDNVNQEKIFESILEKNVDVSLERQVVARSAETSIDEKLLYNNVDKKVGVDFRVWRTGLSPEVMDPRILSIAPNSRNESHKHAHESLFYIVSGEGVVHVGEKEKAVSSGDMVYVPRWLEHHTVNTQSEELKVFAITDYGLTKTFSSNTEASYRNKKENLGEAALVV